MLTLVLCCTCALLVSGCDIKDKDNVKLTVTGCPTTVEQCDTDVTGAKYNTWQETALANVTISFDAPEGSKLESFSGKTIKEFRELGGRVEFNGRLVGEQSFSVSYMNYVSEPITITVTAKTKAN